VGKPLVRFYEGQECNLNMDEIMWHCRESRQKTENTNVVLQLSESPVYSNGLAREFLRHYLWIRETVVL
jgi:hypothetical protein